MGARETALRVLMSCRNNHAWADAALKAQLGRDGLVGPEAALCSRLVYGVVQNQQSWRRSPAEGRHPAL